MDIDKELLRLRLEAERYPVSQMDMDLALDYEVNKQLSENEPRELARHIKENW